MPAVLHLLAHPGLATSRVNAAMWAVAQGIAGVTRTDLYAQYPRYDIDIATEQDRLVAHDVIVLQFPMFWYSCPALLKEWIDLTLEFGFAYGPGGDRLHGKVLQLAVTTGGTAAAYALGGHNHHEIRTFLTPFEQTARLAGLRFAAPYVLHGALRQDPSGHAAGFGRLLRGWAGGRVDAAVFDRAILTHDTLPLIEG
jgi:glutathione-regulated potassium-efflux system ancillary protein KefG